MIPLSVLGGYLGAGKTTIINKLLSAEHGLRVAVIVNDFGAVNIDASLIRNQSGRPGEPILELTNGCVCCSVQDDLGAALESIRQASAEIASVDHAIIEASGVALPARIADYGNTWPGYRLAGTLVVVDASNIAQQRKDKFIRQLVVDQMLQADLLLVTKLDLLSAPESRAVLNSLSKPYLKTANGNLPLNIILDPPAHTPTPGQPSIAPGHADFHAFSVAGDRPLPIAAVEALLQALPPDVVRGKGWFYDEADAPWVVDCVGERRRVEQRQVPGRDTRLLFIAVAGATPPATIANLIGATTGADSLSWF